MNKIILVLSLIVAFRADAEIATVTKIKAQYFHPFGKVFISYERNGDNNSTEEENFLWIIARDCSSGREYLAKKEYISGDIGAENGLHRIVWNIAAQGLNFKSQNIVFRVVYGLPKYLLFDLSRGDEFTSCPISFLFQEPEGGWTEEHKTTKLVMRLVEPGTYKMSGTHNVRLTKSFYIAVFEVTQKQYELVKGENPSFKKGEVLPVENISWNQIRGNYNWPMSKKVEEESFMGKMQTRSGLNFDLPTEAQWEYACRAGATTDFSYGDEPNGDYMWYYSNSVGKIHEVGSRLSNLWGLYDMHGNVYEWCLDWYGELTTGDNPLGAESGDYRVFRGGCFDSAYDCSLSYRGKSSQNYIAITIGFRPVVNLQN